MSPIDPNFADRLMVLAYRRQIHLAPGTVIEAAASVTDEADQVVIPAGTLMRIIDFTPVGYVAADEEGTPILLDWESFGASFLLRELPAAIG